MELKMKINKFITSAIAIMFCLNMYGNDTKRTSFKSIKNSLNIEKHQSNSIINKINEIYNQEININKVFNNEEFSIKFKVIINSNGLLRYTVLEQSLNGYENKIKAIKIIEDIRKKSFKSDMDSLGKSENEKYKYKELIFEIEIGNIEKYY